MHKLAEVCIRRPVFATMLILALTVVGAFSYFSLNVDLLPKVDLPTVSISVSNPGAAAEDVETEITKRIEDAVNTISGIEDLRSTSVEGLSRVTVSFELEKNGDVAAQEIRDKVAITLPDLPETAKAPVIQKIDLDAAPILQVAISSGSRPLRDVTEIADKQIKQKLENIAGVGEVRLDGGLKREIRVWVDPDRMRAYNLSVADVANALRNQDLELPAGSVTEGAKELTVRTLGRVLDAEQFNDIAIAARGSYVVKLRDVGHAEDSTEEPVTAARLNAQPSVTLTVLKQSGTNTVATSNDVKERLEEIKKTLPKDLNLRPVNDQSVFIRAAVDTIKKHLLEGSLLAALIIFVFLANWRTTLIAAVAIPTSIISTFALMAAMGFTLNQITMLALTLMVGVVIDDAIIVLENIYRFIEEKGMKPFEAAIEGTREIGLAVMATTMSLFAVFLPIGFMGGIVGRFMSSFGFTCAFAIGVSMLVSFTLTPMLSSRFIRVKHSAAQPNRDPSSPNRDPSLPSRDPFLPSRDREGAVKSSKDSAFFRVLDRGYTAMLNWSLDHRKSMVAISVLVVVAIVPLFIFVGKSFTPVDDRAEYQVNVRTEEGSSLAATTNVAERIARDIRALPGVTDTLTSVGTATDQAVNRASIYVKLVPEEQRRLSQQDIAIKTREILARYPKELRTSIGQANAGAGGEDWGSFDIQFALTGPDLDKLAEYSKQLVEKLKTVPKVVDADTTLIYGKPELRVEIDRQRAADLGVRVSDIAQALNSLIAGQVVSTFPSGGELYDVRLRAAQEFRTNTESLKQLTVASNKVGSVTLDQVVRVKPGAAPSNIDRLNRQRQVTVNANVLPGGSQADVLSKLRQFADDLHMESGYGTATTGQSKELGRTAYYFMLAIALTFIFMYMVLAAQFESFLHPFTILLTLPLAIPFGILSLLMAGQTINVFSGLGLLLLFGIVKKNAILQIDHTNGLLKTNMPRRQAIIQANRDRLRPILMTTMALVAGMLPLAISGGAGSATNRSIGVLVVGGQSLCLLLTLLAVPVFYSIFEDMKELQFFRKLAFRAHGKRPRPVSGEVLTAQEGRGGD